MGAHMVMRKIVSIWLKKRPNSGIGISGLGIGSEWNDNFLDKLATITGGTSMYVPSPQDIQHALLDKFNQLGKTYTEETRLEFNRQDGIDLRYAFRLEPEAGLLSFESPDRWARSSGTVSLKILMEFVIQPEAVRRERLTFFDGSVSVVQTNQSTQIEPIPIRLIRPVLEGATATLHRWR